ncbi:TIGR03619 family F420-dependent LLM class oxidoreductase [Streptosporangium subroseum]|uniref:TIGR03619 family F420-dependent LLM class oxidoreductase n=1 Tax=Streptosporangium subroseum TaxID=106412 RepID=UPI00342DFDFE
MEHSVQIGVNVPNFGPGTDPATLERWARVVEGLGFDLLMVSDHVTVTPDVAEQYPSPFYEPFTTLAWLAGITKRIRIGTTVLIMPYRHPLLTARMATSLHLLSGGRFVLGVGVGWARQEFEALGVPFNRRGAMTDDYLAAVRAHWDQDVAEHHGPFADFTGVHTAPRPDGLPIWVGGNSDAAMRRAIRYGDAWHPISFTMPWFREALVRLRAEGQVALAPRIKLRLTDTPLTAEDRRAGEGTLGQVSADLEELREFGAETVVLDPFGGDPEETRHPERHWSALATVIDQLKK